jgi:hypothetical protein
MMEDRKRRKAGPSGPEDFAHRVLTRASEIDSVNSSALTIEDLRQASLEAGIAPDAFEQALIEAHGGPPLPHAVTIAPPPRGRWRTALLSSSKTVGLVLATMLVLMLLVDLF